MRSIDAAIISAIESGAIRPFLLLDLDIGGSHYRYTDCDVPLVVDADRFEPRGFSIEPVRYSLRTVVDSLRAETVNLDDALTAAFVGGTPQGSPVVLQQVLMDTDYSYVAAPITWFAGELDDWNIDEGKLVFTVTSELVRWSQRTLAKHSASCRWKKFKGTECAYAGAGTWCDRTYARCTALGNTVNFGGFRFLPSIMDKEIWWGANRAV